ncbi:transcriptional regulator [Betaproteobacteria bacterium]|nr:transcriptional regulator [Betaproteobacteria bacterium]
MKNEEHDKLARRLTDILLKLNNGEQLDANRLAEEFSVHPRTIKRDLLERFAFLPLERNDGLFALETAYLGKLSFRDMEHFAALAGLNGLFPGLDTQFFRELFDERLSKALNIHGPAYEDIQHRKQEFQDLRNAISERRLVRFTYQKDDASKPVEVAPYRLINHDGVWYLAASDNGQPKAYAFGKIRALEVLEATYTPDKALQILLDREDSIWLNEKKIEVVLTVGPRIASYFKRRKLIAQQVIEKELEDGGLLVSGKFAHPNQILPIVRYWLPHVRIVSPESWQEELEKGLADYLKRERKP